MIEDCIRDKTDYKIVLSKQFFEMTSTDSFRINESRLFVILVESLQVSISSTWVFVDGHCELQGFEYALASRSAKNVVLSLVSLGPW